MEIKEGRNGIKGRRGRRDGERKEGRKEGREEGRILKSSLNSLKIGYVIAEYPYLDEF